jgi:hypothetical protein
MYFMEARQNFAKTKSQSPRGFPLSPSSAWAGPSPRLLYPRYIVTKCNSDFFVRIAFKKGSCKGYNFTASLHAVREACLPSGRDSASTHRHAVACLWSGHRLASRCAHRDKLRRSNPPHERSSSLTLSANKS